MLQMMDQTWDKALGYVDREPYRSLVASRLAKLRFGMAISDPDISGDRRIKLLRSARELSPESIPHAAYLLARLTIAVPGARAAVQSPAMKALRPIVGRGFGVLPRPGDGWHE